MSIGAVGSGSVQALQELPSIMKPSASKAGGTGSASGTAADSSSVSSAADMMSKLKDLQQKDPAKFKQAMATIASKLKDAASAATDPGEKKALIDMSQKFATAGTTGDLSGLTPGRHKAGGGHRHSSAPPPAAAAASSSTSGATVSAGAADTNGDGKVSTAEQQAYDAQQAGASAKAYQSAGSDMHARREATMTKISSIVSDVLGAVSG